MSPAEHLRPESVYGYEHRLLEPDELRAVHSHIAQCEACRAMLAQRMELNAMIGDAQASIVPGRSSRVRQWPRYLAAAAAVLMVSGTVLWLSRRNSTLPVEQSATEAPAVKEALRKGRVDVPAFVRELAPPGRTLMGESGLPGSQEFSPKATGVLGLPVEFRWTPMAGAWKYQVRVFSLTSEPVAASPEVSDSHWICNEGLAPGTAYQWQVTATRGEERVTLPSPTEAPPRFRILESADADRLRALARRQPVDPVLLGVEYGRAGLIDESRAQLSEAIRLAPQRTELRRLLDSLPEKNFTTGR